MLNEIEAGQILGQDVKEGFDKEKLGRALMESENPGELAAHWKSL